MAKGVLLEMLLLLWVSLLLFCVSCSILRVLLLWVSLIGKPLLLHLRLDCSHFQCLLPLIYNTAIRLIRLLFCLLLSSFFLVLVFFPKSFEMPDSATQSWFFLQRAYCFCARRFCSCCFVFVASFGFVAVRLCYTATLDRFHSLCELFYHAAIPSKLLCVSWFFRIL